MTDLGLPQGALASFGTAINDSGQVAGHVAYPGVDPEAIFRYTDGVGLEVLSGRLDRFRANGINNAGDIVGQARSAGFVYTDAGGFQDLNQLIDPSLGWFIFGGADINDAGQIAAWATGPQGGRALRLTPVPAAEEPPAAPSDLNGDALAGPSVRLDWTDNADNEVGFTIERAFGTKGSFVPWAQVAANVTTYTDSTVESRTVYRYRVQAYNSAGASAWSDTIKVRTGR